MHLHCNPVTACGWRMISDYCWFYKRNKKCFRFVLPHEVEVTVWNLFFFFSLNVWESMRLRSQGCFSLRSGRQADWICRREIDAQRWNFFSLTILSFSQWLPPHCGEDVGFDCRPETFLCEGSLCVSAGPLQGLQLPPAVSGCTRAWGQSESLNCQSVWKFWAINTKYRIHSVCLAVTQNR